jgi:DNA-directed RNA polymerase subunit RPC12/RpoP
MDKNYIKSILQKILNKEFTNQYKRNIQDYNDRLNFACPYCGDSHKKNKAKRGNIYFNRLIYICFNCGKKTTFDRFCKDFDEIIDPYKKLEMIEYLNNVITYSDYQDEFINAKIDNLIDLSELERVFNSHITNISDFKPIQTNGFVYKYLVGRGITPELHKNIYQAKYWRNEEEYEWIIAMLNRRGNKVLGMQIRNLKEGKRRMFKIYNYENLLEWVNIGKEDIDYDINELVIYNKLSYYFNILNVDFNDRITIFEGYIDSLFFPNSIGLVGVNTDYRFLENNNLDIQYFFDNDEAGYKKSEEKLKKGYPVFLWKRLFEDIVNKKKTDDPYRLLHRISKVKDINKLAELVPKPYSKLELWKYFSNDILDIKWIPKFKKNKKLEKYLDYNKKFDSLNYL